MSEDRRIQCTFSLNNHYLDDTLVYDRNFFSFKMGRFQFTGKFAGDK